MIDADESYAKQRKTATVNTSKSSDYITWFTKERLAKWKDLFSEDNRC